MKKASCVIVLFFFTIQRNNQFCFKSSLFTDRKIKQLKINRSLIGSARSAAPLAPHVDGVAVAGADGIALPPAVAQVSVAEAGAEGSRGGHVLRLVAQADHRQLA